MALEKSKPYGEAYGPSSWRYTQDGKFFNGVGEEVDQQGNVVGKKMAVSYTHLTLPTKA